MQQTTAEGRTRCEIWTRVMGYHRPVSHFNTGKKSEHFSRKHFTECVSANTKFMLQYNTNPATTSVQTETQTQIEYTNVSTMNYLLFTTTTCPQCPSFKEFVNKFVKFPGSMINEYSENFQELGEKFGISSVPTLLVFENDTLENPVFRTSNAAELYTFLNDRQ